MKNMKKILVLSLAAVLLVAVSIGGTIAYLTATSGPVENTFEPSNVGVTIAESVSSTFKMVPDTVMKKDPKVTVTNDIDVYVFVEITETNWPENNLLTYAVASGWEKVTGTENVWSRIVTANANPKVFNVLAGGTGDLADGQVAVSKDMTADYMATLDNANKYPKLSFDAYVIQKDPFTSAAAAWAQVKPTNTNEDETDGE